MKKNLIVFGTRPEAIKMAPLVKEFNRLNHIFETRVCVTAQHRTMLDQVLDFFEIRPYYDLNLMMPNQNLYDLTASIISNLKPVLEDFNPDYVYVHGDTTTAMASSIAAFYFGAKVFHVEAGLRTNQKLTPFPEEVNRQLVSRIADYHFAPTEQSKKNLLNEGVSEDTILVTGNTVIDALLYSSNKVKSIQNNEIEKLKSIIDFSKKIILVTGHRRENHGLGLINICQALREISIKNNDIQIVFPVHLNPRVSATVHQILSGINSVFLIEPLSYPAFIWMMNNSYLILTDSGGVQEEAPSLGKPVLVMRETTERPEALIAGTVILVGSEKERIVEQTTILLNNSSCYYKMINRENPYGNGNAVSKIVNFITDKVI